MYTFFLLFLPKLVFSGTSALDSCHPTRLLGTALLPPPPGIIIHHSFALSAPPPRRAGAARSRSTRLSSSLGCLFAFSLHVCLDGAPLSTSSPPSEISVPPSIHTHTHTNTNTHVQDRHRLGPVWSNLVPSRHDRFRVACACLDGGSGKGGCSQTEEGVHLHVWKPRAVNRQVAYLSRRCSE